MERLLFMGHLLCGVEIVKCFVNICLHCNICNLKMIGKTPTLHSPWKNSYRYPWLLSPFHQALTYGQIRLS